MILYLLLKIYRIYIEFLLPTEMLNLYSIQLYGMEACSLVRALQRLESFEILIFCHMMRIRWTDHIRNKEVLRRMDMNRERLDFQLLIRPKIDKNLQKSSSTFAKETPPKRK